MEILQGGEYGVDANEVPAEVPILAETMRQLREKNRKQSIIANLNKNSLPNKFEEIKEWLSCKAFDILSVQEKKIDRTFPNSPFSIEGFKLFRRGGVKGRGGIVVYIKKNILATQRKMKCKSLEAILLHLNIGKRQFPLISAYKPPSVDNTFTRDLSTVLDEAFLLCENVICIGDLNADILHPCATTNRGYTISIPS